jgi:ABC-type antimicrobial peptide transport system permease subunit
LALAIMSLSINSALEQQVDLLSGELGTQLEVRPTGSFGGFGLSEPMDEAILDQIANLPHVASIDKVLTINLRSGQSRVTLTGIEASGNLNDVGGGVANLVSGRYFTSADQGKMLAIISADTAVDQQLVPGDTIVLADMEFEVAGLFESATRFGRMSMFIPLQTLQEISDQRGKVSQATVTADHLENIDTLAASIREIAGENVDVVVPQERQLAMFETTLGNLAGANTTNLVVALTVAGITIFFTLLLAVRERAREIGVLKALGASAGDLLTGFAWEGMTLALLGCLVGVIIFGTAGQAAAGWFLDNAVEASTPDMTGQLTEIGGRFGGQMGGFRDGFDRSSLGNIASRLNPASLITDNLQVSLSANLLATVFAAAALLGTLGGLLPALLALRLKPAEVLRND